MRSLLSPLLRKGYATCLACLAIMVSCCGPSPAADRIPRILLINSYHDGHDWSDNEIVGFQSVLFKEFPHAAVLHEHLDTKHFPQKKHLPRLADLLENKYADTAFDLIIAMDNAALEFAMHYRERLFPDIPLVFCGINDYTPAMIAGQRRITGVAENEDSAETLSMALKLHPATREVIVLHDYTDTGLAMRRELEASSTQFSRIRLHFMEDLPLGQIVEHLMKLRSDSLVLILTYTAEKSGRVWTQAEAARIISTSSAVPVYGTQSEELGNGIVGGLLLAGKSQGQKAAELAIRILRGTAPEDLPVVTAKLSSPMFDYLILQKFGIDPARLPVGATVINKPASTYAIDKTAFWSGSFFTVAATMGIIGLYMNTQRRKRLEKSLQLTEAKFRQLFNSAGDAIHIHDYAGVMLEVNQVASEQTGYSRDELLSLSYAELVAPELRELLNERFETIIANGQDLFESVHYARNGTRIPVEVNSRVIEFEGKQAILSIARDTTEKKQIEHELFNARKLESIGVLAGGIAHDFNNFLTAILGNISLARMQTRSDAKIQDTLQKAEMASKRAAELTQQLLTFSKGGVPVRKLAQIAQIIMDSSSFVLRGSNVRCEYAIADDLHLVEVDAGQMSQVFNNLVINADQAMPAGGVIRISAVNEDIHVPGDPLLPIGRYVRVTIEDQGTGIPETCLDRIFDPYFTTKEMGNGLGLATSYSIIRNHHSFIGVTSKLGEGTTFAIHIPASERGDQVLKTTSREERFQGTGKILVMDDDDLILQVAVAVLETLGFEAVAAKDGREAVDLYAQARSEGKAFDAVIMDITVPGGMGGQEAIARLREIDPKVRAIVSSGYANAPIMATCQKYGFAATLVKPYDISEMGNVLKRCFHDRP